MDDIEVNCTVVARRLGTARRLAGDVTMSYKIELVVPTSDLASTNSSYTASIGAINATALGTAIVNGIPATETNLRDGLLVSALTPPTSQFRAVVPAPTPTPSPTPAPAPSPAPFAISEGEADDASGVVFSFVGVALFSLGHVM